MASLKVPFGLKDGRLFGPDEVSRGLLCGCFCPECGAKLVANHPKGHKVMYFSHHATEACGGGYETAIHLAAKQILIDHKKVLLPQIAASTTLISKEARIEVTVPKVIESRTVQLDSVTEEVRGYEGVIPDIVATVGKKLLFIEIAVTHFVDDEKLAKLERLGIATLEIDLSAASETPSMEDIRGLVIEAPHNRTWLINPRREQLKKQTELEAQEKLQVGMKEVFEERRKQKEAHDKFLSLPDDYKLAILLEIADLEEQAISPFIGITVRGGNSFGVSSKVWQASIYAQYIHGHQGDWVEVDTVLKWLTHQFNVRPSFKEAPRVAVRGYLRALEDRGLLAYDYDDAYAVSTDATGEPIP